MLNLLELEIKARLKGLSLKNAEKDYLQELVLFIIYSSLSKELVFKGGTCLYKVYKLNRFSEDLDFTQTKSINFNILMKKLATSLGLLNIKVQVKDISKYKNEVNIRLLFNGPLYDETKESQCFIPLNISLRERISLEPKKELFIPLYKELPSFEMFAMDEKEILAEKIRTILTRDKARDVYDLWFLLVKKEIKLDLGLVNKKLKVYSLRFDKSNFIRAIDAKKGMWGLDLQNLMSRSLPDFNLIKKDIIENL